MNAVGAREDTRSDSAKERRHLSKSIHNRHVLFELLLAWLLVEELAKGLRLGFCWADLDLGSPRTTQTWECTVFVASATHSPGCLWTSQSQWP